MDVIKKVPLDALINVLVDLFEKGINFIDIQGNEEDLVTKMTITVMPDYIDEEFDGDEYEYDEDEEDEDDDVELRELTKEEWESLDIPEDKTKGLTEQDLNDLL